MKKILCVSLSCVFILIFCSISIPNAKTSNNNSNIDLALIPYLKVLDKLSDEYGIKMYVAEENKESFYKAVSKMTPEQFEAQQRQQYKEAQKDIQDSISFYDNAEDGSTFASPAPIPNADKIIPAIPLQ